ncbi:MAG: sigma 54-interacting transcriptional regulator, partial [Myxococcota bacterium]
PDCRFAHARALQRLGRGDDARALLSVRAEDPAPRRWACRGLRWRLDVDAGEAAAADAEATACGVDALALEEAGAGGALALLWSAYAAWSCGATERATARLAAGRVWADASRDADASSIAARLLQLDGNLAYGRGSLTEAAARFAAAAEAFARAGEPVGGLTLRGTACALAGPTLDLQAGIAHGRAALRGLLAHGQTSALVEAAINLVQLLARVGGDDEARTVATAVRAAVGQGAVAIDRARLCRLDADVLVRPGASTHDARRRAAKAYAVAAAALAEAGLEDEAHDASVRAATFFTIAGDFDAAAEVLVDVPAAPTSPGLHIAACTVRAQLAARRGDAPALETAVASLHTGPRWSALRAAGRLESALAYDKTLLLAVRSQPASSATTRRALAARLLSTVESVMQKTKPIDRPAARAALLSEGGDTSVLRDLLEDLEGTDAPAPAQASAAEPASGGDRYERLLRMYRRFAREDRLEPLLEQIVDAVMELTDAERGAVVIRRVEVEDLSVTRALAEGSGGASYSRSVIERVLASGEPVLSVDAAADDRFDDSRSISHLNLRSVLAVPLRFRGTLLGAAYVDHRLRRGNFGEDDLAHMEAFADLAALAVAHAAALTSLEDKTTQLTAQSAQLAALLERREAEVVALREDARRQAPARDGYRGIIGSSVRMQTVFRMIDRVADADVPVVVYGESGTGKELVARALHDAGGRGSGPFVAENCGAIPETLLESVLFGHAKGAFTGAQKAKAGLFEAANGGTIFLDEVSEMGMPMQTKLLRVLQEGEVRRVGETAARAVDVRVVAACNRDLEEMVAEGTFRRDLYYRINVVRIDLPPLRERVEDIRALIDHFLARHGGTQLELAPSVVRALTAYAWPGNVRQLENEVQRWVALCEGGVALEDLSGPIAGTSAPEPFDPDDLRIRPRVDRMERELIARALEQTGNNQTKAAALLGLSRYGLQKKLKRLAQG